MRAIASATLLCAVPIHKSNAAGKSQISTRRFSRISPSMRAALISILDAIGPNSVIIIIIIMDVRSNIFRRQHHFSTGRILIASSPYISVT